MVSGDTLQQRPFLKADWSCLAGTYELLRLSHELASIRNQFLTRLARDVLKYS